MVGKCVKAQANRIPQASRSLFGVPANASSVERSISSISESFLDVS